MISRITDILPQLLIDALLAVVRMSPGKPWLGIEWLDKDKGEYRVVPPGHLPAVAVDSGGRQRYVNVFRGCGSGNEWLSMLGASQWLSQGPKIVRPASRDIEALGQIECRLTVREYVQPYPSILVDFPAGLRYESCLCSVLPFERRALNFQLLSKEHAADITTGVSESSVTIDEALNKFDATCDPVESKDAVPLLRAAVNLCLLLANYPIQGVPLYPKELDRDAKLRREKSERGQKARDRAALMPELLSFAQTVELYRTEGPKGELGEPTGREMPPHWRRGHLRRQPVGHGRQDRKLIFIRPVLVRSDLFAGDKANTSTVYV